ncbi:transposase [Chroococcidiopsis sp.]|uniref:transposase n=1 Tax=Chroococcidiopsis sp. TaxID=3088168 RepID=UPI003F2D7483
MKYDPTKHNRHSIRLQNYDYSTAGAYFITICTHQRECIFGEISEGVMQLSQLGQVARSHWMNLPQYHSNLYLETFVFMPNHLHGILILHGDRFARAGFDQTSATTTEILSAKPAPTEIPGVKSTWENNQNHAKYHALPEIIRGFKTFSARQINKIRRVSNIPVWQRNYYEHIIRNEESLERIRQYIDNNPLS